MDYSILLFALLVQVGAQPSIVGQRARASMQAAAVQVDHGQPAPAPPSPNDRVSIDDMREAVITWRAAARIYEAQRDACREVRAVTASVAVSLKSALAAREAAPPPASDGVSVPVVVGLALAAAAFGALIGGMANSGPSVAVVK